MGKMRAIRVLAPEFIIFSAYLCAFSLSVFVILPLQSLIFGPSLLGSLLFMGHGVRVLSVWLFGIRAIAPLAVAEWLATVLIWQPAISMDAIVLGAVVGGISCWVAFELLRLAGHDYFYDSATTQPSWRSMMLVGAIGSVLNSVGHILAYRTTVDLGDELALLMVFLVGDILGTLALFFVLMIIMRKTRKMREMGRN